MNARSMVGNTAVALNFMKFRTRSPERDQARDHNRIEKVRQSLLAAREDAVSESAGLERRVEEYLLRAALMLESSGAYGERSTEDEDDIVDAESRAKLGRERVAQVRRHIGLLDRMLRELDEIDPGAPQVTPLPGQ